VTPTFATTLLFVAAMLVASTLRAETTPPACPVRPGSSLVKILYLFATGRPDTYATCVYADGSETSLSLAKGCRVGPIDVFHDGPPLGGMHECREQAPGRCKITCSSP
jgi:hypothetical protein